MKKTFITLMAMLFIIGAAATGQAWQTLYSQDTNVGKSIDVRCDNGTTFRVFQNTHLYKDKLVFPARS